MSKLFFGLSFTGFLTLVLVVLKLFGVIAISWIWVFCPLWATFVLGLAFKLIFWALVAAGIKKAAE